MKAGRTWWMVAVSVAVALAAAQASAAKPAEYLKFAPANHDVFIYADITQARNSPLYQELKPQIMNEQLQMGLAFIQQLTGMKVPDDLDVVAASGHISDQQNGCLYVRGKFNRQQIEQLFSMNPGYTEIPKENGGKIIGFLDEKKGTMSYLTFLSNDLGVIGHKEAVEGAYATYGKKGKSMADNPAIMAQMAGVTADPMLLVVAARPQKLPANVANVPVIQDLKSAFVSLIGTPDALTLTARAEAQTAQMANQWLQIVEGAIALGQIQNKVPKLAEMARQASAKQQGAIVEASARIGVKDVSQFVQQQIAKRKAAASQAPGVPAQPHPEKTMPQW